MFGAASLDTIAMLSRRSDQENIEPEISIHQNIGHRTSQEDRYVSAQINDGHLLAVLDGHAGRYAADIVAANISSIFKSTYDAVWNSLMYRDELTPRIESLILRKSISKLRNMVSAEISGTTLSLLYARPVTPKMDGVRRIRVIASTLGDSPLVIHTGGKYILMPIHSAEHHKGDITKLMKQERGSFIGGYLYHTMRTGRAMTRSLGNYDMRDSMLRYPDVKAFELSTDSVIAIGSDGVLSSSEPEQIELRMQAICHLTRKGLSAGEIVNQICEPHDNITLCTMRFCGGIKTDRED